MAARRSGSVELQSARWSWTAEERQDGWLLHFQDRKDPESEMRSWVKLGELTDAIVREAALDPIYRRWTDGWGREWEVTVEVGHRRAGVAGGRDVYVRFYRPSERYHADVSADTRLGELTRGDLARLLAEAGAATNY